MYEWFRVSLILFLHKQNNHGFIFNTALNLLYNLKCPYVPLSKIMVCFYEKYSTDSLACIHFLSVGHVIKRI